MSDHPILFSAPMIRALLREIEAPGTGKTQTRRIIKPQPFIDEQGNFCAPGKGGKVWNWGQHMDGSPCVRNFIPEVIRRRPGDRLWVREKYYQFGHWEIDHLNRTAGGREKWRFVPDAGDILIEPPAEFRKGRHHKDPATPAWHKRLGRFMSRRHSRLTLYVSEVRVERLQDISDADAIAEGIHHQNVIVGVKCYGGHPIEITADRYWNGTGPDEFDGFEDAAEAYADLWDRINGPGAWDKNPFVAAYTFRPALGNIDTLPATIQEAA